MAVRGLTKRYGSLSAVDHLDLAIERGQLYGFLGPNGAGKTTTIRMILGLIHPSEGSVEVLDEPVAGRAGWPSEDRRERLARIDEVLRTVGLEHAAAKKVKAYSQGMRQRLGIALALLGEPDLLVLDEPTNGLDPQGMREVRLLLRRLADEGTTVFVSSHLLWEVEAMCDRVGVLAGGRLVADGPPSKLRPAANATAAVQTGTTQASTDLGTTPTSTSTSTPTSSTSTSTPSTTTGSTSTTSPTTTTTTTAKKKHR